MTAAGKPEAKRIIVTGAGGAPAVCVLSGIRDGPFLKALDPDHIIPSVAQLPKLVTDDAWTERMAT